ncbi:GNAT family N-acetyltransferase [Trueperella bialowiezensis]|uniref:Acetyltransferase (GNAT) family n=1 Tax=Trueperella bialowiezensis TaxID=312285 RepID=A0A448PG74_9ACTO|nr:GNAT family protein [Trueperella bialowiezensis]VEI13922.1 Acetyltransferase (GNAT) family [Trueperella bialowiezensis]
MDTVAATDTPVTLIELPVADSACAQVIGPAWQRVYDLARAEQIEVRGHADYLAPTTADYRDNVIQPRHLEFPFYQFAITTVTEPVSFNDLEPDDVVGTASAVLPQKENTFTSHIGMYIDPDRRRRGFGRAGLGELRGFLREHGRTQAESRPNTSISDDGEAITPRIGIGTLPAGDPTVAFLQSAGFGLEMVEKVSELDLETFSGRLVSGAIEPPPLADSLEILIYCNDIIGKITPEFVAAVNAFNADHPQSDSAAAFTTTVEDYTRNLQASADRGNDRRIVIIRERDTQQVVATTHAFFRSKGSVAQQVDTWVRSDYRERGLATLAKIELYRELLIHQPRIKRIQTENAESNVGMCKVNDRLGFEVTAANSHWVSVYDGEQWVPGGSR